MLNPPDEYNETGRGNKITYSFKNPDVIIFSMLFFFLFRHSYFHRNIYIYIYKNQRTARYRKLYKQTELAYKNRSFRDRESNHGPPAFRADVLTITPPRCIYIYSREIKIKMY